MGIVQGAGPWRTVLVARQGVGHDFQVWDTIFRDETLSSRNDRPTPLCQNVRLINLVRYQGLL